MRLFNIALLRKFVIQAFCAAILTSTERKLGLLSLELDISCRQKELIMHLNYANNENSDVKQVGALRLFLSLGFQSNFFTCHDSIGHSVYP